MESPEHDALTREAMAWFDVEPGPDDWVNQTWIGRQGPAELRMMDVVTGPGRHTLLVRLEPNTDPQLRSDDLDYESVLRLVDEVKASAAKNGLVLLDFAGPAVAIPEPWLEVDAPEA